MPRRPASLALLLPLALALGLGCAPGGGPEPQTAPEREVRASATEPEVESGRPPDPEQVRAVERALERATAGAGEWHELHVLVECADDAGMRQAEVFGNGVAVWDRRRQLTLPREELVALLERFRRAGFGGFQEMYGTIVREIPIPQDPPPSEDPGWLSAIQVICRVVLTLDGVSKQSVQLAKGPRSAELDALAHGILDSVRPAPGAGIAARDLEDGLARIGGGGLAPETLTLLLHRKPASEAVADGEEAWILRLEGRRAAVEPFRVPGGYGDPVTLDLDGSEVARVATLLADAGVGTLPENLWAGHYTDLVVAVLDHEARIQARRFSGMTPATHGEAQQRFDRLYQGLADLAHRVLREGDRPEGEAEEPGETAAATSKPPPPRRR